MNRIFTLLLLSLSLISCNGKKEKTKVLFVTTNVNEMNGTANGTYLIELAVPFDKFSKAGYDIDIVSPKGGEIPIYHSGDTTNVIKPVIDSELFKKKTQNSLTPTELNPEEYLAVIIPGGYGQFWDTHKDKDILRIISEVYDSGGTIGSIGHGIATLIDVKLKTGEYLVHDKTMTSFPSWNEKNIMKQSDFGKLLPYDMEEELSKRGANLKVYDHQKKINYEIVDAKNRLVTASFANSGNFIADEVLKLITKTK